MLLVREKTTHTIIIRSSLSKGRGVNTDQYMSMAAEGSWDEVTRVIGQAHSLVHQGGVSRIQSSWRVGTR